MKIVITQRPEHQLGLADFDRVARLQRAWRVDQLFIEIDQSRCLAGHQPEVALLGIVGDGGVLFARDTVVADDYNIHRRAAADEVLLAVDAVVTAAVGAGDADQPSHHRADSGGGFSIDRARYARVRGRRGRRGLRLLRGGRRRNTPRLPLDIGARAAVRAGTMLRSVIEVAVAASCHRVHSGFIHYSKGRYLDRWTGY